MKVVIQGFRSNLVVTQGYIGGIVPPSDVKPYVMLFGARHAASMGEGLEADLLRSSKGAGVTDD